ncbi:retinol dehydrogenase 13 [Eupeodes corollae]|uniref:retinol dehydrogenase 13 n=1 Tax=Eupeodes corollae TaxID=290404 RepID=UPI0024906397|nr:retinol dehydrogenase 13 [Eupeodes corollae]
MDKVMSLFEDADPLKTWWPFIIAVAVGVIVTIRTLMGGQRCPNVNQIDRQVVIVTGGNSGIGMEISKALAGRGGHVIMACRDLVKSARIVAMLKRELSCRTEGEYFIETRCLDLRSFDSVKRFARDIQAEFERVDILINNAGVIFHPESKSVDGFEMHLQVNYLAPFLLTHLLLPHLKKSDNGRVINVSAHAHATAKMDFDDPLNVGTWAVKFHARDAFSHSKLAVILATKWLARELKGSTVTVNACTPGLVRGTSHLRNSPLMSAMCVKFMTFPWMWLFMKNPQEGAQTAVRLATDPQLKLVTGEYFNDCEIATPSEMAKDKELAKRLFMETMRVLKLTGGDDEKD